MGLMNADDPRLFMAARGAGIVHLDTAHYYSRDIPSALNSFFKAISEGFSKNLVYLPSFFKNYPQKEQYLIFVNHILSLKPVLVH
jgi:hypothetical protein